MKNLLLTSMAMTLLTGISVNAAEGPHGGKIIQPKPGESYEVVTQESTRELKVYTTTVASPLPNRMIIKVTPPKGSGNSVNLQLIQKDAQEAYYSGIVPANVSIAAGVKFEFEFFKKKTKKSAK